MAPSASILFPTRRRRDYLAVALASVAPQAEAHCAEMIVVEDDAADPETERLVWSTVGATSRTAPPAASTWRATPRSTRRTESCCASSTTTSRHWLDALLRAAATCPEHEALGGPIRPVLEGTNLHACGREPLPITALDLGSSDLDAEHVWGANMALRRGALDRIGRFDPALGVAGAQLEARAAGGGVQARDRERAAGLDLAGDIGVIERSA